MKSIFLILFTILVFYPNANSQITELFEDESVASSSFTAGGVTFNITSTEGYDVLNFAGGGWNGTSADNQFIDNSGGTSINTGTSFTLKLSDNGGFSVTDLFLFCSRHNLTNHSGTLTITGKLNGDNVYSFSKSSGFSNTETFTPYNGFTYIDFATEGTADYTIEPINELVISSTGNLDYMALDAFRFELQTLPVNLISFRGLLKEKTINLLWETAQELNNEKFEIEGSRDGREFLKIGEVKGMGTTVERQNYSFEVKNLNNGISYYRLKQIDFDGQFEYSNLIRVDFKEENQEVGKFYPNPSISGLVNLVFTSQKDTEIPVFVFDITGKIVLNQMQQVLIGGNNINFDFSELNPGIYIVKIGGERNPTQRKLIIER